MGAREVFSVGGVEEPPDETGNSYGFRQATPWEWAAGRARRQHGVITLDQLIEFGLNRDAVAYRVRTGYLIRLHRGVFALGHRPRGLETVWMAASLAADGAPLSHRHAGALWGITARQGAPVHLSSAKQRRSRSGIVLHHLAIEPDEVTTRDGIPVTTKARTLLDLAGILSPHQLEIAFDKANLSRLDLQRLGVLFERYPNRKGIAGLGVLAARLDPSLGRLRSTLEASFARWLDARGIPLPERNVLLEVAGTLVQPDCLWRAERVILELDGRHHLTQTQIDADKSRDRRVRAAGYEIVRVSGRMLEREPDEIEADLRRLLTEGVRRR